MVIVVVTYHGDCVVAWIWVGDEEERIFEKLQKRFVWAAVTGAESRELGSERVCRAWRLCQGSLLPQEEILIPRAKICHPHHAHLIPRQVAQITWTLMAESSNIHFEN